VGTIKYGWQLQHAGCGVTSCTTYTGTIAGDTVAYVWQTSGRYEARLTAMDSEGRTATTTLQVPVAGVPPVLTLDPSTPATATTAQPVNVVATLDHAGTLDNETVTVDWGDGTPVLTSGVGPNVIFMATPDLRVVATPTGHDPALATITATHLYTQPGTYQVRITVTDSAGQTDHLTHTVVVD
jgi:PKD repeat protein